MNYFVSMVLFHVRTEKGSIEPSQIVADLECQRDYAGVKEIPAKGLARLVDDAVAELLESGRLKREGEAVIWVPERVESVAVQTSLF